MLLCPKYAYFVIRLVTKSCLESKNRSKKSGFHVWVWADDHAYITKIAFEFSPSQGQFSYFSEFLIERLVLGQKVLEGTFKSLTSRDQRHKPHVRTLSRSRNIL